MPKLDELIRELCPDGVEYKPMSEVIQFLNGRAYKQTELLDNGKYKVLRVGNFYTNENWYYSDLELEPDKYCERGDLLYTWAATLGPQIWNEDKAIFHYHIWKLKFDENLINKKFLYHFLSMDVDDIEKSLTKSTMPHVSMASMNKRIVPLPPLEIQREIVRILDNFTNLTAELTAELTFRKKQLDYYRENLIVNSEGEIKKLGEVVDIYLGLTATPKYTDSGVKFISAQNTSSDYLDLENVKYISENDYKKATSNAKPKRGDLLFTRVGSNLGHPVIVETDEELCIFVSLGFLRIKKNEEVSVRYLKHWMNTDLFWSQVRKNVHGAAKVNLNTGWLRKFEISIPTLSKQNEIADVLDQMDRICSDFISGLPVEIEARQKQYSYYRNRLLYFENKA